MDEHAQSKLRSGYLCYQYMQEHLISNFASHSTAGHLFTDNVTTYATSIIGPAEGKMISHMRRIHLLTYKRSYAGSYMPNYRFKSTSALLYFVNAISADFSGTVLMHRLI